MKLRLNMLLKDVDKGWQAIASGAATLAKKGGPVLDVGISDGMGEDVLKYARAHEYGHGAIPERSYVRATIDKNEAKYKALVKGVALAAQMVLEKAKSGAAEAWQKSAALGLDKIGRMVVADIRARIESHIPPDLKPATIARKRAQGMPKPETPLIGRGVLIKSVSHRVRLNAKVK